MDFREPFLLMLKMLHADRTIPFNPIHYNDFTIRTQGVMENRSMQTLAQYVIFPASRFLALNRKMKKEEVKQKLNYHFRIAFWHHPELREFVHTYFHEIVTFAYGTYGDYDVLELPRKRKDNIANPVAVRPDTSVPIPAHLLPNLLEPPEFRSPDAPFYVCEREAVREQPVEVLRKMNDEMVKLLGQEPVGGAPVEYLEGSDTESEMDE